MTHRNADALPSAKVARVVVKFRPLLLELALFAALCDDGEPVVGVCLR
jgi:hypothetical protein